MKKTAILIFVIFQIFLFSQNKQLKFKLVNYTSIDSLVSLRGIFAVDGSAAWVSGSKGSVYVTSNEGKNWQKKEVPLGDSLDFRDIEEIAPGTIILMSAGVGEDSRIYKSTDDGETWKIVYHNSYPDGFLDTIEFWNRKNGIAIGDPVDGKFNILFTTDGGTTWEEPQSKNIPDAFPGEAQFAASGTCISVIGKSEAWIGTGGTKSRILKTTDNGMNWKVFPSPLLQGKSSKGIFSIHFVDKNKGIIVGGNYLQENAMDSTSAFSIDGGRTWKLNSSGNLPYQSSVKSFKFHNRIYFISTGPGGTFYTEDLKNWYTAVETGFHSISVSVKDNSIWLAGSNGRVAKLIIE
ncbi:MAG: hypothetical protein WB779_09935 [Ignavibacteriaceae bacterium]|jgi:photosystem II stability/assembly factor-like uncharacterized protein